MKDTQRRSPACRSTFISSSRSVILYLTAEKPHDRSHAATHEATATNVRFGFRWWWRWWRRWGGGHSVCDWNHLSFLLSLGFLQLLPSSAQLLQPVSHGQRENIFAVIVLSHKLTIRTGRFLLSLLRFDGLGFFSSRCTLFGTSHNDLLFPCATYY